MCMVGGEGTCKSLLKCSLCQKPETCTDSCCFFPKPQTLFAKVIHHHLKQPELSPSSPPSGIQTARAIFLDNSFLSPGCTPVTPKEIPRKLLSWGISVWNGCFQGTHASGSICLPSEILSRKVSQGEQKACIGKCPEKETLNRR